MTWRDGAVILYNDGKEPQFYSLSDIKRQQKKITTTVKGVFNLGFTLSNRYGIYVCVLRKKRSLQSSVISCFLRTFYTHTHTPTRAHTHIWVAIYFDQWNKAYPYTCILFRISRKRRTSLNKKIIKVILPNFAQKHLYICFTFMWRHIHLYFRPPRAANSAILSFFFHHQLFYTFSMNSTLWIL